MDGFAYAGESLVGRYIGARDRKSLVSAVRHLLVWGLSLTLVFTIAYHLGGEEFLRLFSDKENVINAAHPYLFWVLIVPVCGFAAFLFDGIFIGATASKTMRDSMFVATALFFAIYYFGRQLIDTNSEQQQNNMLWLAFMVYLTARGLGQAIMLRKAVYSKAQP